MTVSQLSTRSRTYPVGFFSLDREQGPTQLPLQGQLPEWLFILSHHHLLDFRFELASTRKRLQLHSCSNPRISAIRFLVGNKRILTEDLSICTYRIHKSE
jgi:hypothetical protein